MIDGFEFLDKGSFDRLHIAEAEGGIAQETVGDLRVDDAVDELRLLEAASTASAIMSIPVSFVNGLGPG